MLPDEYPAYERSSGGAANAAKALRSHCLLLSRIDKEDGRVLSSHERRRNGDLYDELSQSFSHIRQGLWQLVAGKRHRPKEEFGDACIGGVGLSEGMVAEDEGNHAKGETSEKHV